VRATDCAANVKQRRKFLVGNCVVVKQCCEKGVATAVLTQAGKLKVQTVGSFEMNRRGREGEGGAVGGEGGGEGGGGGGGGANGSSPSGEKMRRLISPGRNLCSVT
jgi:uncharacterized membrane protein YgcG